MFNKKLLLNIVTAERLESFKQISSRQHELNYEILVSACGFVRLVSMETFKFTACTFQWFQCEEYEISFQTFAIILERFDLLRLSNTRAPVYLPGPARSGPHPPRFAPGARAQVRDVRRSG